MQPIQNLAVLFTCRKTNWAQGEFSIAYLPLLQTIYMKCLNHSVTLSALQTFLRMPRICAYAFIGSMKFNNLIVACFMRATS